LVLGHR